MSDQIETVVNALRRVTPDLLRWSGAVAKQLRQFNISLENKTSGSAHTDALTLADLTVQELVVAGLRDGDPVLRTCRMEAEESNGDLDAFAKESSLTIALDPIDGTKQFRDHSGDGYAVMIHLRDDSELYYSLVFAPEAGPTGTWTQVYGDVVKSGPDDTSMTAFDRLEALPKLTKENREDSKKIYLIGFQKEDPVKAKLVTDAGLHGFAPDEMPGSIYQLLASGEFGGSLIHTPNIYDYPVSLQIARTLGGQSVWCHSGEPVHFRETWMDDRADMLRLPGIVATADSDEKLQILVNLAREWNRTRYNHL